MINDNDIWYIIELKRRNITIQNNKAPAECLLNGFIFIPKNNTKTREEILKFRNILSPTIKWNVRNKSIDIKPPIMRNEQDLKDFRKSSFKTLSIKVKKNTMKKEANTKLRIWDGFKEAKYKGQVIKLRYVDIIK